MTVKAVLVVAGSDALGAGSCAHTHVDALEHIANRPIADHVLESLQAAGINDIIAVSPAGRLDAVREALDGRMSGTGTRVRYVGQPSGPLDFVGALRLAAPLVGAAPCVAHLASGLLDGPLDRFLECLRCDTPDLLMILHRTSGVDERLSPTAKSLLHVAELDPSDGALGVAGVCLFAPGALQHACAEGPSSADESDLTSIAHKIFAAGGRFDVRLVDVWRRYAGDPLDLLELNRIALDRLDTGLSSQINDGNRIEGRVQIHQRASVRSSVIVGPTIIGPGAQIADAYIGPYTSVGAGARIEGAEVERSIISGGASVMHVGGRLVASVLGRDARVFRDFSLPRALRLRVGERTEIALC